MFHGGVVVPGKDQFKGHYPISTLCVELKSWKLKTGQRLSDERERHNNIIAQLGETEKDEMSAGKVSKKFQSKLQGGRLQFLLNKEEFQISSSKGELKISHDPKKFQITFNKEELEIKLAKEELKILQNNEEIGEKKLKISAEKEELQIRFLEETEV